jgi:hypothetical protein
MEEPTLNLNLTSGWIAEMRRIARALGIAGIPWQKIFAVLHAQLTGDN